MIGMFLPRGSRGLAVIPIRAAARARSCSKMLMVSLEVFSLLVMGRVMTELGTSTGDATMDKAMKRVVTRNAENMIDRCSNMGTIPDFVVHYICGTNVMDTSGTLCWLKSEHAVHPLFSHVPWDASSHINKSMT